MHTRRQALLVVGVVAASWTGVAVAQVPTTLPPEPSTTEAPQTTAPPATPIPQTTARPPTTVRRVPRSTTSSTVPPTTTTSVVATLPPVQTTIASLGAADEPTKPGEGKMPAWPAVLSIVGLVAALAILAAGWIRSRPGRFPPFP